MWALLQDHEPWIGHEESVYANKARSWTEGGPPAASWGEYRPPGLPLLGTLALRLNDDVGALRAVTLLLALAMLTATYLPAGPPRAGPSSPSCSSSPASASCAVCRSSSTTSAAPACSSSRSSC
ncbi:hypothetical protein [Streptomyces sp. NPDC058374]|uniref:hypothetical protein n=1 Tax=Streptomyces sp. NPDC058374 TaxID=3346466 RepID=UPI003666638B